MDKIRVAGRLRPPAPEGSSADRTVHWKVKDNRISLYGAHNTPVSSVFYAFDHLFDENYANVRVFELLIKDIIHAAVDGFNGSLIHS